MVIRALVILSLATASSWAADPAKSAQESKVLRVFQADDNWFLPTGTEIKTTIQNAIFSFNLRTPVTAIVDDPVICPKTGEVILPRKTRLLGTADILKSDDRVNVRFQIAVLENGREFEIDGIALSPDGSAGVKGTVKEYKDVRLMSSAVTGALRGVGESVSTVLPGQPLVSGALGGALTQGAQEAQSITSQKVDVSISVPPFQKVLVFLSRRLTLDGLLEKNQRAREGEAAEPKKKDWKSE
jgi:hypothetical protein